MNNERDNKAIKMVSNILINVMNPLMKKDKLKYAEVSIILLPDHIMALAYGVIDKKITFQEARETTKELYFNLKEAVIEMEDTHE